MKSWDKWFEEMFRYYGNRTAFIYETWHYNYPLLNRIRKLLPKNSTVIELGCGTGIGVSIPMDSFGYKVTAADIDPKMLSMTRTNAKMFGSKIKLEKLDFFNLPKNHKKYNLSISVGVIEHFPDGTVIDAIKAHKEMSNRYVVIVIPSKYIKKKHGDENFYSVQKLRTFCKKAGLEVVETVGYGDVQSFFNKILWTILPTPLYKFITKIFGYTATVGVICKVSV